ncbi:uncharacterized protein A1O9_02390 [Exophiala aquamarina CBS 119918]|uniref:Uncharacterized protein n=1 Tax=Exophiala aquamarina CBS 119918 TaxID=1182545 RepID=A0A072PND9_9EURO|nr:uncharacterized protein A1O9_02390 [Exophiala aquamarina CBS 119918]KEF60828.1 hypothetical protein A1O9_02390 [Exophiala aquamarina CBS 119918]
MEELNLPMQELMACSQQRANLVKQLWGSDTRLESDAMLDMQPYLEYYRKECCHALHDGGRHVICRYHSDILEIAKEILNGTPKERLRNQLRSRWAQPNPENLETAIDASIDLTARLVSMANIGMLQFGVSAGIKLPWEGGSIQDLINGHFVRPGHQEANARLERNFKGCNLNRNAGIKIVWTSNLADHLRITDEEVAVFHHASFLKHHRTSGLFPLEFVDETLQTLALLFPQNDKGTIRWLNRRRKSSSQYIDQQLNKCGFLRDKDRQIQKFRFWRERLIELEDFYDEYSPRTIRQLWRDRRDGLAWHTFWAAMLILFLTIFFGIVQSVEGALQVYKAYFPTTMN